MFRVKNKAIPYVCMYVCTPYHVFYERFTFINHQYPTRFSQNNFAQRKIKLSRNKICYIIMDHVSRKMYLNPFKGNVPRKIVLRNQLKKHSSKYAMGLIIFECTFQ